MYNKDNIHYIFKQSNNTVWSFFFEQKRGLLYSVLGKDNIWNHSVLLQKNINSDFYVDMDANNKFHLVFQDKQGSIFYSLITDGEIDTIQILKSKLPSCYNKNLRLLVIKNSVHFFYTLKNDTSDILVHQELSNKTVGNPKVIDYISNGAHTYCMLYDTDNISLIYQRIKHNNIQIACKNYIISKRQWGENSFITPCGKNCKYPKAIIDQKGITHICYQQEIDKQFDLIYKQKISDKNIWGKEIVIDSSSYPFDNSSILLANEELIVYWVHNDVIFFKSSQNNGASWSKKEKYNFVSGKYLLCFNYKTNNQFEKEKIISYNLPGCFSNGYKLAFFDHASYDTIRLSSDEFRNMLVNGLNLLKHNIAELKESNLELTNDIMVLKTSLGNMQRELTKYSIKMDMLKAEKYKKPYSEPEYKEEDPPMSNKKKKKIGKIAYTKCKIGSGKKYHKKTIRG